jgi:hypothetical protein
MKSRNIFLKNQCTTRASVEKRSTSASPHHLSPRLAHTGMAFRDARGALLHKAELDGSGAAMRVCAMARHMRCGSGSGPLRVTVMIAICVCYEKNQSR